jgi:hypothetical protein
MNVMAPAMQVACKAFIVPNPAARSPKERYNHVLRSLRRVRHARCFNGECPSEATDKIGIRHIYWSCCQNATVTQGGGRRGVEWTRSRWHGFGRHYRLSDCIGLFIPSVPPTDKDAGGLPVLQQASMPRQRFRSIKVACSCMILNQCCSETLLKIVFQQYRSNSDIRSCWFNVRFTSRKRLRFCAPIIRHSWLFLMPRPIWRSWRSCYSCAIL